MISAFPVRDLRSVSALLIDRIGRDQSPAADGPAARLGGFYRSGRGLSSGSGRALGVSGHDPHMALTARARRKIPSPDCAGTQQNATRQPVALMIVVALFIRQAAAGRQPCLRLVQPRPDSQSHSTSPPNRSSAPIRSARHDEGRGQSGGRAAQLRQRRSPPSPSDTSRYL